MRSYSVLSARADPLATLKKGPTYRNLRDIAEESHRSRLFAEFFDRIGVPPALGSYDTQMRAWRESRDRR